MSLTAGVEAAALGAVESDALPDGSLLALVPADGAALLGSLDGEVLELVADEGLLSGVDPEEPRPTSETVVPVPPDSDAPLTRS